MIDLANLLLTTDTDTLKNDARNTSATFTVPGSATVAAAAIRTDSADVSVGSLNSSFLAFYATSKEGSKNFPVNIANNLARTGTVGGSPAPYSVYVTAQRVGGTTIRVRSVIYNPYGSTLTLAAGNEVFTFVIRTLIDPF